MMTAADRLQIARFEAGFQTATDAARAHGWNENTYRSHENGERGLRIKAAMRYALAFKRSVSWIITGEGAGKTNLYVPVRGRIKHGGLVVFINQSPDWEATSRVFGEVVLQFSPQDGSWCYVVDTDHLMPRYGQGDVLVCWNKVPFDAKNKQDGIVWISDKEAGLQICTRDIAGNLNSQSRFKATDYSQRTLFDPIQVVVRDGFYFSDDQFAERILRLSKNQSDEDD